jgi:GGDEF domain-containing protein
MLPGNGPIGDQIRRRLVDQQDFIACYVDLDFFKPFNDVYGYAQGDQIILYLADLLRMVQAGPADFLGHVGGDDFVLVLNNTDWQRRIQDMQERFSASLRGYYSLQHHAAGGIEAPDRHGAQQFYPLMSISVAALDSRTAGCTSPEAVAQLLVEVKKLAKQRTGNSLLLRSNIGIADLTRVAQKSPSQALTAVD